MTDQNQAEGPKFRPERAIYLNTENTGFKTKDQVIEAIHKLRALPHRWRCAWSEKIRPLHFCFDSTKEFQEFKNSCKALDIKLREPVIVPADVDAFESSLDIAQDNSEAEATSTADLDGEPIKP